MRFFKSNRQNLRAAYQNLSIDIKMAKEQQDSKEESCHHYTRLDESYFDQSQSPTKLRLIRSRTE